MHWLNNTNIHYTKSNLILTGPEYKRFFKHHFGSHLPNGPCSPTNTYNLVSPIHSYGPVNPHSRCRDIDTKTASETLHPQCQSTTYSRQSAIQYWTREVHGHLCYTLQIHVQCTCIWICSRADGVYTTVAGETRVQMHVRRTKLIHQSYGQWLSTCMCRYMYKSSYIYMHGSGRTYVFRCYRCLQYDIL